MTTLHGFMLWGRPASFFGHFSVAPTHGPSESETTLLVTADWVKSVGWLKRQLWVEAIFTFTVVVSLALWKRLGYEELVLLIL